MGEPKTFTILKQTLPINLARISNQIVCVCAYLSNFKPVLVPPAAATPMENDSDVEYYLADLSDSDGSGDEYTDSD